MDAATFEINIEAKSIGLDATDAQLTAFAAKIQKANTVATVFDTAVAAASASLEKASTAAKIAAEGLGAAEKRYRELESAANTAAKAVEKAAAAGKDTKDLASAAASAKAKMEEQAKAVEALRLKSKDADTSQKSLADTLGILKDKQSAASKATQSFAPAAAQSEISGKDLKKAMIGVEAAAALVAAAVIGAVVALGVFAVQSNKAASSRLSSALTRLQTGFRNLFAGLRLDKFVAGLEDIGTLFDKGTSSANGMKVLIETIFQPLFDGAAKAAPLVKEMFKGMIHGALLAVIAVLEIRNAIFKSMSPETRAWIKDVVAKVFTLHNAFRVGTVIAIAFAVAVGLLVAAIAALVAPIVAVVYAIENWGSITDWLHEKFGRFGTAFAISLKALVAPIVGIIDNLTNWGSTVDKLKAVWDKFVSWLKALWDSIVAAAKKIGGDIASGIIGGLTFGLAGGEPAVGDSMKTLLSSAKTTASTALDAHSPSRVYAKLGATIPAGVAQGVEGGTADVQDSVATMVTPPASVPAPTGGSGGAPTVHIEKLSIGDGPVAKENFATFMQMLKDAIRGVNITIGGGEVPST